MTDNPDECPECGALDTRMEWRERRSDDIVETRTCKCGTMYDVNFGDPQIRNVEVVD